MLVAVAPLPLSFLPPGTMAFYSINRPHWANISDPSVYISVGIFPGTFPIFKSQDFWTSLVPGQRDLQGL